MQLTIRAVGENVQVISHLLAKNPNNLYERNQKGHAVRLFFSSFTEREVEATVFVAPDSLELVKNQGNQYDITHYINDREFAVSSIFISLIRNALGTALNGQPKEDYIKWVKHPFDLEISFGPVASGLSDLQIVDLFEPLGFDVSINRPKIEYSFKLKSKSTVRFITLKGRTTLQMALRQIFVLIPVLDNYKHYFIDEKEIEKLKRYGEGWLDDHPQKSFILKKALRFKNVYELVEGQEKDAAAPEMKKIRLNDMRYEKIVETVKDFEDKESIVDLGSGEGKLSTRLGFIPGVKEILAVEPSEDASIRAMERFAQAEGKDDFIKPTQLWGSLFYYDERLKGKDVVILCEVIEHIDEDRLPKVFQTILQDYRPKNLVVTTPNKEYNALYEMDTKFRHGDHRFEWTREEFEAWCSARNTEGDYELIFDGIGELDEQFGFPTQMCIFKRKEVSE
ncbi:MULTISPECIES: 3' terminal RNA ribose 2'-O-methyltransferase Hen1 [unclassified Bacillus (in: firmicutes)]|uniref:3' terminal RNA ribose 2'-O-methyltransferase Hen1 n=1 Tax=unclassified Bacillus (in: firmicutes) TaxID=185979 RepID=UPI001BE86C9F|nr:MULTISPECIES: 3' terminal RNA ribose 2'-O-methyltransferase Hen1 [unclassified Bacillus (in: firmicutes)]MBT2636763.1 3' terminal RNA ribose 2'-O-methyltransferase Hen1 [Bacillus sp. ISL-39]MBT2663199.1 3' terminal RNA ribose 2'-O-methyltransferase Hen1 [Bacillus sp. ISL-45]